MYLMWMCLWYIFTKVFVNAEVITLIKEKQVTCVATGSTTNSPIYLHPPVVNVNVQKPHKNNNFIWSNDDWNIATKNLGIVIDKRWEDFKIIFDNKITVKFTNVKTYGFSVCTKGNLAITKLNNEHHKNNGTNKNETCDTWIHYRLDITRNNEVYNITLFKHSSNEIVDSKIFHTNDTEQIQIESSTCFWKIHKLKFKEASNPTNNESSSTIIPYNGKLRVSLPVYLNAHSKLNITLESNNQKITNVTDGKTNPNIWQNIEMEIESINQTKLSLFRDFTKTNKKGYWGLGDIKIYSQNIEIHQMTLQQQISTQHICKALEESSETQKAHIKCGIGRIGNKCEIECNTILGNHSRYCQKYNICYGKECNCAWGYRGTYCQETCHSGFWGSGCNSKCYDSCDGCNHITGECSKCKNRYFGKNCTNKLPVLLKPPVLKNITDNSITILIEDIKYTKDESKPESYIIQYKKQNEDFNNFTNDSYSEDFKGKTFHIENLSTRRWQYTIRIILETHGQAFTETVPELKTHKRSLEIINLTNNTIHLKWTRPQTKKTSSDYTVHYECQRQLCKTPLPNKSKAADTNFIQIKKLKPSTNCTIRIKENQSQLTDMIHASTLKPKNIESTELPKSVKADYPISIEMEACEKFNEALTYHFTYRCVSEWCKNETTNDTIEKDNEKQIHKASIQLLPFTTYEPVVIATRGNTSRNKTFSLLTTSPGKPHPVRNLSVYCANSSTLWLRWQPPYPPTGIVSHYLVLYRPNESNDYLQIPNNVEPCSLWDNFNCTVITNLKNATSYTLKVQAKNKNFDTLGEPQMTTNLTTQNASQAPDNLKLKSCSQSYCTLMWDHPLFMNGPIKKFCIQMEEEGKIKIDTVNVQDYHRIYNHTIAVEYPREYIINVWAVNQFGGEKVKITITTLTPEPDISSMPFVEACSKRCVLLVPKSKSGQQISVLVKHNDKKASDENLIEALYSYKNKPHGSKAHWIVETSSSDEKSNYFHLEIGEKKGNIVSTKNRNYNMYLIVNDSGSYNYYPLEYRNESDPTKGNIQLVIFIVTSILVAALLLAYLYYVYRFKKMPFKNEQRNKRKNENVPANETKKFKKLDKPTNSTEMLSLTDPTTNTNKDIDVNTKYVKIDDFEKYLKASLKGNRGNNELSIQHQGVAKLVPRDYSCGLMPKNFKKNRYLNLVAYDFTRVILEDNNGEDYINANYIDGFDREKAYIATQGPKFSTVKDFWRMVWQEQTETIVMATNFIENKKRKCAEYWPQRLNAISEYGEMTIQLTSEEIYEHYDCRIFKICYKGYSRKVRHFHLKWNPDNLTPFYPNNVVPLVKRIREISENSESYIPPIVIHCSSGVNRTGTLILCDLALQMAKSENRINFYKLLKNMREQRPNMVKSEKQYILAHLIVLECLMEQENLFKKSIKENLEFGVIKRQLNYLDKLHWHDTVVQFGMPRTNSTYHSYTHLPVDGYGKIKKYLIMQRPTEQSITEFWNTVINEKIDCILFLQKSNQKEKTEPWPHSMVNSKIVTSVIEIKSIKSDYCTFSQLLLSRRDEVANNVIHRNKIFFFQMNDWDQKEPVPSSTNNLLNIVDDISNIYSGQRPILVACHDGVTACGLFTTLSYVVEKYQKELEVDICNAVRTVRRSGAPFLNSKIQMEFLYQAVMEYQRNFDSYASIE